MQPSVNVDRGPRLRLGGPNGASRSHGRSLFSVCREDIRPGTTCV